MASTGAERSAAEGGWRNMGNAVMTGKRIQSNRYVPQCVSLFFPLDHGFRVIGEREIPNGDALQEMEN